MHDKIPKRIRFLVPIIQSERKVNEHLKQSLIKVPSVKGIYPAVPKHQRKNFFTRKLVMSSFGNVIAGLLLARFFAV